MKDFQPPKTYEEAMLRLQSILEKLESGKIVIDELESSMEEAKQLTTFCESKLRSIEDKLLENQ